MFTENSRYKHLGTNTHVDTNGKVITYARRRFLRRGASMPLLVEVTITEGDRLDLITAQALGDPEQYWRVCDANDTMNPTSMTNEVGRRVRIPIPQFETAYLL